MDSLSSQTIIFETWNGAIKTRPSRNTLVRVGDKVFMQCRKITPQLKKIMNKQIKETSLDDILYAINIYGKDVCGRDSSTDFANHRFSLYEFMKQGNGFIKFLNR